LAREGKHDGEDGKNKGKDEKKGGRGNGSMVTVVSRAFRAM